MYKNKKGPPPLSRQKGKSDERERERAGKVSLMQNKAIRQAVLISNNNRRSSNRVIDIGQGV